MAEADEGFVFRRIAEELILVPISRDAASAGSIYGLNEVAARIWELIDGQRSSAAIRDVLVSEFEVSPAEAERDLLSLLSELEAIGAVRSCG